MDTFLIFLCVSPSPSILLDRLSDTFSYVMKCYLCRDERRQTSFFFCVFFSFVKNTTFLVIERGDKKRRDRSDWCANSSFVTSLNFQKAREHMACVLASFASFFLSSPSLISVVFSHHVLFRLSSSIDLIYPRNNQTSNHVDIIITDHVDIQQ